MHLEKNMRALVIALVIWPMWAQAAWAQDVAAGEQVFRRICLACHDVGPEAKTKLGPPLNGVDGRKAGTFEGYNYSEANKSSGIVWNEETFPPYIRAPMQAMPGTKMSFVGLKNDKEIADVWIFLKQFGRDGQKK
jgi:cytochrome c